jgi:DNA-binding response OmpR family regulator
MAREPGDANVWLYIRPPNLSAEKSLPMIELGGNRVADPFMRDSVSSLRMLRPHELPPDSLLPAMGTVSALIVERSMADALPAVTMLGATGFHVTLAETFAKAKERLSSRPPSVLITDVRLGEYNGLHLVLRGKSLRPDMAAIVLSDAADPVLQADAEAMGATFVVKPVTPRDFCAAVMRTLARASRGQTAPIRPPFERRSGERRMRDTDWSAEERRRADRRRDLLEMLGTSISNA